MEIKGINPDEYILEQKRILRQKGFKQVFTREEVNRKYDIVGHTDGVCVVVRKSDLKSGTMNYIDDPRLYFNFKLNHR